jgi:hypothetical protein
MYESRCRTIFKAFRSEILLVRRRRLRSLLVASISTHHPSFSHSSLVAVVDYKYPFHFLSFMGDLDTYLDYVFVL